MFVDKVVSRKKEKEVVNLELKI